jgi:hypothetical protein
MKNSRSATNAILGAVSCRIESMGLLAVLAFGLIGTARADAVFDVQQLKQVASLLEKSECVEVCEGEHWYVKAAAFPSNSSLRVSAGDTLFYVHGKPLGDYCGAGRCVEAYLLRDATRLMVIKSGLAISGRNPLADSDIPLAASRRHLVGIPRANTAMAGPTKGSNAGEMSVARDILPATDIKSQAADTYALSNTPSQTGAWTYVAPIKSDPPIENLWGYDSSKPIGSRLSLGSTSYYKPIDSMLLAIGTRQAKLHAFPNVNRNGDYDNGGHFQCTALVSSYLSLLGFLKAPSSIANGKDVVKKLVEGPNREFFSPIDALTPPRVGSIISMNAGTGGVADSIGHVAIAKGVTVIDKNRVIVSLIEQNIRNPGTNESSVHRGIEFNRGSDGIWHASHSLSKDSYFKYSVLNWTTPIALP